MNRFFLGFETSPAVCSANQPAGTVMQFAAQGHSPNVRGKFCDIHNASSFALPEALDDLLALATYCLEADKQMPRGNENDLWLSDWPRDICVKAKVCAIDIWNDDDTKEILQAYLSFLTGDNWAFEFEGGRTPYASSVLFPGDWQQSVRQPMDSVLLFSGGLDSLGCLIQEIQASRWPILVSHSSNVVSFKAQKEILKALGELPNKISLPYVAYYSAKDSSKARAVSSKPRSESTQRARGFLYSSIGLTVAVGNNLNKVILADNGITSLNLPALQQSMLARNSRATHPKSLCLFQELMDRITPYKVRIENPLRFATKADVIKGIESYAGPGLVEITRSCFRSRHVSESQPLCGTCSQCVDRRFGGIIAQSKGDMPGRYITDILKASLDDWKERMEVVGYVNFAKKINQLSEEQLYSEFTDLAEIMALPSINQVSDGPAYATFLKRHAAEVMKAVNTEIASAQLATSTLPDTNLLRLVAGSGEIDPRAQMIDVIRNVLRKELPGCSGWAKWKDELEAHKDVNTILSAWSGGQFDQEAPQLPFAGIAFKPDASQRLQSGYLYIEVKYLTERKRFNGILTEITSRTVIYPDQGAFVLFLVLDPLGVIPDREKLIKRVEGQRGCWIAVVGGA